LFLLDALPIWWALGVFPYFYCPPIFLLHNYRKDCPPMATFSLDQLKETVSEKYEPTIIENGDDKFVLPNLLQLPEKRRNRVIELTSQAEKLEETGDAGAAFDMFEQILLAVVEDDRGQELIDLVDNNSAIITEIFTAWTEGTQVGEA